MDILLEKYNDYMRLKNCRVEYTFSNQTQLTVHYREENFPHLLGLHKLKDLQLIQFWQDKNNKTVNLKGLLRHIKNSSFTDSSVKSSIFYPLLKDRYESFSYENLTSLIYTDAIIHFNPELIHSKLKSDYILFEKTSNSEFNHLAIAQDARTGSRYFETFFHESTIKYISGQVIVQIRKFTLYDPAGHIIVEDSFQSY